jgi:hypothetical protein
MRGCLSSRRRGVTARARRRPFTGFLYYGPFGLSYLLTIHFVWTYMGTLEKLQFAEPSAAVSVRLASTAPRRGGAQWRLRRIDTRRRRHSFGDNVASMA